MNISKQLKSYRKKFNLSQEELAEIIHVSRPTISNWENGKSYPDLQSLLLLSDYFKISLDELVKGDVLNMQNELEKKEMDKFTYGMLGFLFLALLTTPLAKYIGWYFLIPFGTLWGISMWCAFKVEKIKKSNNLKTYQEILAYMENREIPYLDEKKRKKRAFLEVSFYAFIFALVSMLFVIILLKIF
ncbi:transcriptional regulator [Paraclostridium bifermentans]|uniref:helix-turn-helix domain-containing protein n=1 Tax=Paraclostridium bifermentans TaxID=1490 RepID=UPI0021C4853F|nr:helix-turn-helix transcriptional regulator [Paraclostridium bifermentans]GKZ02933.1 transcriptional regulator [Paraclostridium bifermentans]GKZ07509.1 transcriptional regulator [Paraclostridium bifermentans]GKZ08787.1 transcriptional regulator [Paraclostridium bifermentans]